MVSSSTQNERQYLDLLRKVDQHGEQRPDRTGTGTKSLFGEHLRFNLQNGFPLLTTKKVYWKGVVGELLWFLRGESNVKSLQEDGVHIWDEWAKEDGALGPVYGVQWRSWGGRGVDQIANLVKGLKENPFSRRHVVSAWNAEDLPKMALEPCHVMFQFYVSADEINGARQLSCHMYQRSADLFLGVPFNIASYALLTHMLAQVCGYEVGTLTISFGDVHIYNNHAEQVRKQLKRDVLPAPILWVDPEVKSIDDFKHESFDLVDYNPHPAIPAPVAV